MKVAPRYTLFTPFTQFTIQTALHCLNSSTHAYIYRKRRLERYWYGLMSF